MKRRASLTGMVAAAGAAFGICVGASSATAQQDCELQCFSVERSCCSGGRCAYTQACSWGGFTTDLSAAMEHRRCVAQVDQAKLECEQQERQCVRECRSSQFE